MFKRTIAKDLKKALERAPVVLLNGARQVGKSTLALEFMKSRNFRYITFDDEILYLAAKNDPSGFISNLEKPVIIDEVQRVPEIFLPIKRDVDTNRIAGRYLLTGSANPLLIPNLGDSLAGRMEIIDLMPLSQGELLGKEEKFIDTVFSTTSLQSPKSHFSKEELFKKIIIGGYPSVQQSDEEAREAWMRSYINLILQRDIKDLANIEKITALPNLLKILSYRAANLLNIADIARECKMVTQTVNRYIALLETIFLINLKPAWNSNLGLRFTKAPKIYMVDTGLLSYLLEITPEKSMSDGILMGKVLENFIVSELQKQITWSKTKPSLYHFRTSTGEEVDIILESRGGHIVGIEIKSHINVEPKDFKGLTYLQQKVGKKFMQGIVLYPGSQHVPFGNDMHALPIHSLWD